MSAPHVTGLVALMWRAAPCLVGNYAAPETIIEETATPIPYDDGTGGGTRVPNYATGWGEINALAAVSDASAYCGSGWLDWVSVEPITDTLTAGNQPIEITFTCTPTVSQQNQPLCGTLWVWHNDPCQDDVEIALEFFCSGDTPSPAWDNRGGGAKLEFALPATYLEALIDRDAGMKG